MTGKEIIELLGGITAVARMLDIKPPSVHAWTTDGIPEGRLRDLAGQIELRSGGRFTRRARWPDKFAFYWPELAPVQAAPAQAAINPIAVSDDKRWPPEEDELQLTERRVGVAERRQAQQPFTAPDRRTGPPERRGLHLPEVSAVLLVGV